MENKAQKQYTKNGQLFKRFLHTKIGARLGYLFGISGYNRIDVVITDNEGKPIKTGHAYNSRVNVGAALTAYLISGTNLGSLSSPGYARYIALSTSTLTPAAGDTTLSGETSATGLGRALGTAGTWTAATTLDGVASYILNKSFVNSSGGSVTINSAAIFDAATSGNMFVEANLGLSYAIANGNGITINWTINL